MVRFAGTAIRVPEGDVKGVALLAVKKERRKVTVVRSMFMALVVSFCGGHIVSVGING